MTFSERILIVRGAIKQRVFASKLEINPNTLRNYENGRALPNFELLEKICVRFSVNPEWLLLGSGPVYQPKENTSLYETGVSLQTKKTCPDCLDLYAKLVNAHELLYAASLREKELIQKNAELQIELEKRH